LSLCTETVGEFVGDQCRQTRDEAQAAVAPLQKQIATLQQQVAELKGFRDGLIGKDLPTSWFKLRGKYRAAGTYNRLDIVSRDGAWWIARHDDPGPLGGDGWKQGPTAKRGDRGLRGATGPRGPQGRDAPKFVSWDVDRANYHAIARMSDGTTMAINLRPLFEQFLSEVERRGP
jgi:hypothetical protein